MKTNVHLPITEVLVLEDRAHVVRSGPVALEAGVATVVLDELSPVLVDKSVVAKGLARGVEVLDARIERRKLHLAADLGTDWKALDALRHEAERRQKLAREALARVEAELADAAAIEELLVRELAQDLGYGRFDAAKARADLALLGQRTAEALARRAELAEEVAKADREVNDVARRRSAAAHRESREVSSIALTVRAAEAGTHALRVEYVVPNAAWRPQHVATLRGGELEIRSEACVWQRTGEDWSAVSLRFSTERPSLGAAPPSLETERLSTKAREQRVVVETREQAIEDTGLGRSRTIADLPGIDDGGESLDLRSAATADVPSDGMPHRIPVSSFRAEATLERVLVGERVPQVLLRCELDHRGSHPILAGPVDLLRDNGYVGRTTLLYVAPGERFELGFGPDPELRVHRETAEHAVPRGLVSPWRKVEHFVTLKLSNLGPGRVAVRAKERIPVSEVEKVKVSIDPDRCEPRAPRADANGMVSLSLELGPYGRTQAKLVYVVEKHDDVVG